MDELLAERGQAQHLPAELRKGAPPEGHLGVVQRRAGRLGGEAGELDGDRLLRPGRRSSLNQTPAVGSRGPNGFTPLKTKWARPSQKLLKLKTALMTVGVLRAVTRRMLTPSGLEHRVGNAASPLSTAEPGTMPTNSVSLTPWEPTTSLASRSDRGGLEVGVLPLVEGEIGRQQGLVGAPHLEGGVTAPGARVDGVLQPVVRAGMEVAAAAGLDPVAPDLHVPEKGLAQLDGGRLVLDELEQVGGLGHRYLVEGQKGRRRDDLRSPCRGSRQQGAERSSDR